MIFSTLTVVIAMVRGESLLNVNIGQVSANQLVFGARLCRASNIVDAQDRSIKALRGKVKAIRFICEEPLRFNSIMEKKPLCEYVYTYPVMEVVRYDSKQINR